MMDSVVSNKTDKKHTSQNLNNTIQPISNHMTYGSVSAAGKQQHERSEQNTRNWKNKSIENTPDEHHHKRGGSHLVGDIGH